MKSVRNQLKGQIKVRFICIGQSGARLSPLSCKAIQAQLFAKLTDTKLRDRLLERLMA